MTHRQRKAFWLPGLLVLVLAGSLLANVASALAAPLLSWSSPAPIDSAPPEPILDGVSCVASECVAVDEFGNVVLSSDVTADSPAWSESNVDGNNELHDVSCVPGPLCVAVDGAGDVVVSIDPAGGVGAWSVAHVDGSHALLGVSCVAGPLCVAVDDAGDVLTSTDPTGGEHAWTVTHLSEEVIHAVSCATTSLCVAVENGGNVLVSTKPTVGEHAWIPAHVDGEKTIFDVSCPSISRCVAVDLAGDVLTSSEPAGGASKWTVSEVGEHALGAVSCASPSNCVAVDGKGDVFTATEPAGGKSAWRAAHIDPGEYLLGVSCDSDLCAAVNGYGDAFTATNPGGGAGSWTSARVDNSNPESILSVSCASVAFCMAVDNAKDVLISTEPLDAGAWRTTGPHERGGAILRAVSCPSAELCLAAGEYGVISSDPAGPGPTVWTNRFGRTFPELINPGVEYLGPLDSIACASVSLCVANLDSFNDFDTLATSTDPASSDWHGFGLGEEGRIRGSGNHRPPPNKHDDAILGVSCPSESLCIAVDAAGNAIISTDPGSSESTWTIAPVETQALWGISCPSTSLCVAIDHAGDVLTTTDPSASMPTWTTANVDGSNHLTGVSCASESLCVAGDAAGNVLSSTDPAGGPGAWSVLYADAGHAFTSVSCTLGAAGLCVAVDDVGYAVMSAFSPPAGAGQHGGGEESGGGGQPGGTTASTTSTGPVSPPAGVVPGVFRVLGVKTRRRGQIVLTLDVRVAGSINAHAATSARGTTAGSRKHRRKGTHGTHARKITYGIGSAAVVHPGIVTVTIKPTKSAFSALKSSRTLPVRVTVVFHSRHGLPATLRETVVVRYRREPARHPHARSTA